MIHPDIASHPDRLAIYQQVMQTDGSPRFAEMCALQSPPGTKNTERAFMQGAWRQMEQMDPKNRDTILADAKKAGISTQGKCFKSGIGHWTDPAAWVTSAEDVLAVAKARNYEVSGVVNHKAIDKCLPPKRVKLAPDIVKQQTEKLLAREPALAEKVKKNPKKLAEVHERVIATHSRKK